MEKLFSNLLLVLSLEVSERRASMSVLRGIGVLFGSGVSGTKLCRLESYMDILKRICITFVCANRAFVTIAPEGLTAMNGFYHRNVLET